MAKLTGGYSDTYIGWFLKNDSGRGKKYAEIANSFISSLNSQKLVEKYRMAAKKNFKESSDGKMPTDAINTVLSAAEGFSTQNFQQAIDAAFSSLQHNSFSGIAEDITTDASGKIIEIGSEAQRMLSNLDRDLDMLERVFSKPNLDLYYTFLEKELGFKLGYQKILNNNSKLSGILREDRIEALNKEHQKQYDKLIKIKQKMDDAPFLNGSRSASYLIQNVGGNETVKSVLNYVTQTLSRLRGLVYEVLVKDIVSITNISDMIDEQVLASLPTGAYTTNIRAVSFSGAEGNSTATSFKYNTSDLKILVDYVNNKGEVVFSVDQGISLKVAKPSSSGNVSIKIKNSSFGKLLKISAAQGIISRHQEEAIQNILANSGRDKRAQKWKTYTYKNMEKLLKTLHDSFTVVGLAGAMTTEDFTTHIIINNKVYSVLEILSMSGAGTENSIVSAKLSRKHKNHSAKQAAARRRHKWIESSDGKDSMSKTAAEQRSSLWLSSGLNNWKVDLSLRLKV